MHANVALLRFKNREEADRAVEKFNALAANLPGLPGFQAFTLVRTGETETVSIARFATEENAAAAREKMLPKLRETLGPHLSGDPDVRPGPVVVAK